MPRDVCRACRTRSARFGRPTPFTARHDHAALFSLQSRRPRTASATKARRATARRRLGPRPRPSRWHARVASRDALPASRPLPSRCQRTRLPLCVIQKAKKQNNGKGAFLFAVRVIAALAGECAASCHHARQSAPPLFALCFFFATARAARPRSLQTGLSQACIEASEPVFCLTHQFDFFANFLFLASLSAPRGGSPPASSSRLEFGLHF